MDVISLLVYVTGLALAFGVRTARHRRQTGSSGFNGISGPAGSAGWWGGVLFVVAVLLGIIAPAASVAGVAEAPDALDNVALHVVGLVIAVAGLAGVLAAQSGMGTSWRVGVSDTDRTDLVTSGLFAYVRNPVFTAMMAAQLGMTLAVPTWLSLLALASLVTAIQLQVRWIEEPYLIRSHGEAYREYAARTGRFLPGIGTTTARAFSR
jgi:protein-S-isoprenylcysteine O-methyltransferase Ste14